MKLNLEPYLGYDPHLTADLFTQRGWKTNIVRASNAGLVQTQPGSPLLCIDGRYAELGLNDEYLKGPKIPGGLNGVALVKTGGDVIGFNQAVHEIRRCGFRPGTHGDQDDGEGCGLFKLWRTGALTAAQYPLSIPFEYLAFRGFGSTKWIKIKNRSWRGMHFTLPGVHKEEALVLNCFTQTTLLPRKDRFTYDEWLMRQLGIPRSISLLLIAETVEQLAPQSTKVELLVPNDFR